MTAQNISVLNKTVRNYDQGRGMLRYSWVY